MVMADYPGMDHEYKPLRIEPWDRLRAVFGTSREVVRKEPAPHIITTAGKNGWAIYDAANNTFFATNDGSISWEDNATDADVYQDRTVAVDDIERYCKKHKKAVVVAIVVSAVAMEDEDGR